MKSLFHSDTILTKQSISTALVALLLFSASLSRASDESGFQLNQTDEAGDAIVHGKLGGLIFGFEVDPNGTEGLLCEAVSHPDGTLSARVETFSQSTGRIIRVLGGSESQDDFIALGVAGSVGVIEHEKVRGLFNIKRTFSTINPLRWQHDQWGLDATDQFQTNRQPSETGPRRHAECSGLRPERCHEREPGCLQLQSRG